MDFETKAQLEWQLDTYYKRREKYREIIKNCNRHLKNIQLKLKIAQKNEEKFKLTTSKIEEYFGEKVPKAERFYKDIYCKYCLENGIKAEFVAKYLKYNRVKTVYDRRKKVRKQLIKEENRQKWQDLKMFMKT